MAVLKNVLLLLTHSTQTSIDQTDKNLYNTCIDGFFSHNLGCPVFARNNLQGFRKASSSLSIGSRSEQLIALVNLVCTFSRACEASRLLGTGHLPMDTPSAALGQHSRSCSRPNFAHRPPRLLAQPHLVNGRFACRQRHVHVRELREGLLLYAERQCGCWGRARRRRRAVQAVSADMGTEFGAVAPQPSTVVPLQPVELSRLTTRILFGTLMGAAGAAVILAGGWVFTGVTCLVVYQASQEFYGFVTSKVCLALLRSQVLQQGHAQQL